MHRTRPNPARSSPWSQRVPRPLPSGRGARAPTGCSRDAPGVVEFGRIGVPALAKDERPANRIHSRVVVAAR